MLKQTLKNETKARLSSFLAPHRASSLSISTFSHPSVQFPEDIFKHLSTMPWSMWLDSCQSEHIDSRFDIMVWQPAVTLTTSDEATRITRHQVDHEKYTNHSPIEDYVSNEDPLALINEVSSTLFETWLTNHKPESLDNRQESKLPFLGGALGYFSYDLGRQFEKLPNHAVKDINQPDMAVGVYQQAIIYDRQTATYYLISSVENEQAITKALNNLLDDCIDKSSNSSLDYSSNFSSDVVSNQNQKTHKKFALTSPWHANMTKEEYANKFSQVQRYLLSGDCYQINLAQRFQANYQGDEFSAYLTIRNENKAPFSAFIRLNDSAILSTSPERFLQLNGDMVQTKPIKGTRPRSSIPEEDSYNAKQLSSASKDRAENLMIVDLLRNDLSKVCLPNTVKVPEIFAIESFPAVHHLVSTIVGQLDPQYSATDLLRGAFPGGSITGAPKIRAMEIIDELEPQRRHLYCGSIGYISACGTMDTSITIRTLICENNTIYCCAGGGLVADSEVDSEYQETMDKINKILPVLSSMAD